MRRWHLLDAVAPSPMPHVILAGDSSAGTGIASSAPKDARARAPRFVAATVPIHPQVGQEVGDDGRDVCMITTQLITFRGRPVALVLSSGHAVVDDLVDVHDKATVDAMCVYAIEVATGQRRGPYTDAEAEHHARQLLQRRPGARPTLPRRQIRPGARRL